MLRRGRYTSYWNAKKFLLNFPFNCALFSLLPSCIFHVLFNCFNLSNWPLIQCLNGIIDNNMSLRDLFRFFELYFNTLFLWYSMSVLDFISRKDKVNSTRENVLFKYNLHTDQWLHLSGDILSLLIWVSTDNKPIKFKMLFIYHLFLFFIQLAFTFDLWIVTWCSNM